MNDMASDLWIRRESKKGATHLQEHQVGRALLQHLRAE